MRIIIAEKGKPINLGRVGEDITKVVKFDLSEIAFPNATYTIAHRPQGATASYFGDSYVENGMLCWLIHDSDLVKAGIGRCEVIATGNGVAKSYIYQTRVDESIDDEIGEVPPPYQPWVDSVLKEFAFSHKLENITCNYISIPHDSEPHCDTEETDDGLILTFYIPMGADGKDGKDGAKGDKGDTYELTEQDKSEIASQIHYDDTELRAEIESKEYVVNKADAITDLNKDSSTKYPTLKAVTDYVGNGNNLPAATYNTKGAIKLNADKGVAIDNASDLVVTNVSEGIINQRLTHPYRQFRALTVDGIDYAVKQALCDGKGAPYTEAEKKSARERIGAEANGYTLLYDVTLTEDVNVVYISNIFDNYNDFVILLDAHKQKEKIGWTNSFNVNYRDGSGLYTYGASGQAIWEALIFSKNNPIAYVLSNTLGVGYTGGTICVPVVADSFNSGEINNMYIASNNSSYKIMSGCTIKVYGK